MPTATADLTTGDIVKLLHDIGLGHLEAVFKENGVNGRDLAEFSDDELKEDLGLTTLQIKKIKRHVAELGGDGAAGGVPQAGAPAATRPEPPVPSQDTGDLKKKLAAAENAVEKYGKGKDLLASATRKLSDAAGGLKMTAMSNGMEMMHDAFRPGLRGGRGIRGRRGDMGHTMIEMAGVKKAQKLLQEASVDITGASALIPNLPFIEPATVKSLGSAVMLNQLLMPGMIGDIRQQSKTREAMAQIERMANEVRQARDWCEKNATAARDEMLELKMKLNTI
jgi:hypothetical protein